MLLCYKVLFKACIEKIDNYIINFKIYILHTCYKFVKLAVNNCYKVNFIFKATLNK